MDPWIQSYSALAVYPLDPQPEQIALEDIAHSLAMKTRFNGHAERFYSVAEHCVRIAEHLLPDHGPLVALQGLMHDSAETYLPDVPRPVKHLLVNFQEIEDNLLDAIFKKFEIPLPMHPEVKKADLVFLATEARDLMKTPPKSWELPYPPLDETIHPLDWQQAKQWFLYTFKTLKEQL